MNSRTESGLFNVLNHVEYNADFQPCHLCTEMSPDSLNLLTLSTVDD